MLRILKRVIFVILFLGLIGGSAFYLVKNRIPTTQKIQTSSGHTITASSQIPTKSIVLSSTGSDYLKRFLEEQGFWKEGAMDSDVYYARSGRFQIKALDIQFVNTPQTALTFKGIQDLGSVGMNVDVNTGVATVSVYSTSYLLQEVQEPARSTLVSSMLLQGVYRTIHPIVGDKMPVAGADFDKLIKEFENKQEPLVEVKNVTSFKFISEVYADSCSNYHYDTGGAQNVKKCVGGTLNGSGCNIDPDCLGGGSCVGTLQCVITGPGSGNCVQVFSANGFAGCAPGNLGNCDNGSCPAQISVGSGSSCSGSDIFCGGCINACRANTQTCNQWINAECGGGGTTPTTPPAPPVNGACGSCNSCGDPDPNKCALLNGVCSKAGYCGGAVGFTGCRIWDHAPETLYVGQTINITLSGFGYDGAVGPGGWVATQSTPGVVNASPLAINFGGSSFGDQIWHVDATGLAPGASWVTGKWTMGDGDNCSNSFLINVLANPANSTLVLTADGNQGSETVASGSNVTLGWVGTNVSNCVASGSWSGAKAIANTETQNNITSNQSFTLTCDANGGGTISSTVDVNVGPNPLPTINLTVNGSPSSYITTFPVNWATQFGVFNTTFKWTTAGATSCVGTTKENSCSIYPFPSTCPYVWSPAVAGWFLWNQNQPVNLNGGSLSIINDPGALQHGTFTLSCTGPGGTTSRTVYVQAGNPPGGGGPVGPGQCALPTPGDPAAPVCALNPPTSNGSITWTWPAVPNADEYSIQIIDATTGIVVPVTGIPVGFVNGQANFSCRPNQTPADTCSYKTNLPPGSYRSQIQARSSTNACTLSGVATYPPVGTPGKTVDLCPAVAWWQSGSGSVFSQGNIQSVIPPTCAAPGCINRLIQDDGSGLPGFAIGGSSASTQTGTGTVSSKNWLVQSSLLGRVPDFNSFVGLIPVSITPTDPGATFGGGTFNVGGASTGDGYYWYRHNGNVNITSDINLDPGRKVILYVDDGDLTISGKISYNPGNSFFMTIVKGNTSISPTVTTAAGTPTLTGIFYCGGQFKSGAGTVPLSVLGSVVAQGGVSLERDLGTQNHYESSESFTISPDLLLNYPEALSFKRPVWKEVAP